MQISRRITSTFSYSDILLDFLRNEVLDGGSDLDEHTPLLEFGVIDSITMVSVLSFIRDRFGVEVRSDEITASNFRDVMCLASMVEDLADRRPTVAKRERMRTAPLSLM